MAVLTGAATALAIVAAAAAAGCYAPELRDCVVACGSRGECAVGQTCGTDGFCSAPEVAGTCDERGGDDGGDDDDDDSQGPDASPPLVDLKLKIRGEGQVRDDAHAILCTEDCAHALPAGSELVLHAEPLEDSVFDRWSTGPCAGAPATCTFVLEVSLTIEASFRDD
jgi:hypothetical protein